MQKGKPFVQGTAQKAARPAVIEQLGVFLDAVGVLKVPWCRCSGVGPCPTGSRSLLLLLPLQRERQQWAPKETTGSALGTLFWCYLWSCHLGYTSGVFGALWPPAALRGVTADALYFFLAMKHQNCCWTLLFPQGLSHCLQPVCWG